MIAGEEAPHGRPLVERHEFVGLMNFTALARDPDWWQAVRNTLTFTVVSVALETVLGTIIALFTVLYITVGRVRFDGAGR